MKQKMLEFLESHKSETPSTWREEAEWRRDNWSWLQYSQKIAVKILLRMKQTGLTQQALAEKGIKKNKVYILYCKRKS